jgi:dipeptidyl aminopeptidase/acylaminoacyl peptidase
MTRTFTPLLVVACYALCALPNQSAAAQEIRTVMVVGNEICVKSNDGPLIHLTDNGVPKSLPVWSKDGSTIAFVEKASGPTELAKLVVVSRNNGHVISEISIKPISPGEVRSGMRFIEELEWLTTQRIAVGGSVNPSTSEYNIVDLMSQKVIREFFDDGKGAAFSPDGQHYAYVDGSPHFTPVDERVPTLNVDERPVFSETQHFMFADIPRWSDDSSSVAVVARNADTGEQHIVVQQRGATTASVISLPFLSSSPASVLWNASDLVVVDTSLSASKAWLLPGGGTGLVQWTSTEAIVNATNVVAEAKRSRALLKKAAQIVGGKDADFWCESCDLTVLRRRSGENE